MSLGGQGPTSDPEAWIKRLAESYKSVKLARGVVGKTTQTMLALLGVWAVIAWQWSDNLYRDTGLLLVGTIVTCAFMWWVKATQSFAERNPAQAMLDGAEFLEYQKFEAQAKGMAPATESILISDPSKPPLPITGTTSKTAD